MKKRKRQKQDLKRRQNKVTPVDPEKYLVYKMTKEEEEIYYAMSEEDKSKYKQALLKKKQKTTFFSAVINQLMLESIDDMEKFGLVQGKHFKTTARQYKTQINAFINKIFGQDKISLQDSDVLTKISAAVEKLLDDHYDEIKKI